MIISNIERIETDTRVRMQTRFTWEQQQKKEHFWVETESAFAGALSHRPEGFLLAAYTFAALTGENQIVCDEVTFDPSVKQQLAIWARVHKELFGLAHLPDVSIIYQDQATPLPVQTRCFGFISGGVDSLSMMQDNLETYPENHPERIDTAVLVHGVYGLDFKDNMIVQERLKAWQYLRTRMQGLLDSKEITLLPLYTNIRSITTSFVDWPRDFIFCHTAVGHFLNETYQYGWSGNAGSAFFSGWQPVQGHPQIGINDLLAFKVETNPLNRFQKVSKLFSWPEALKVCQPCHWVILPEEHEINCGICEKCVRTRFVLLILNAPHAIPFSQALTTQIIRGMYIGPYQTKINYLKPYIKLLKEAGYPELSWALRKRIWRWYLKKR